MEEIIKNIAQKTLKELDKIKKPPYPLYYKETFNHIADDMNILEQLNPKLLCLEPSFDEKLLIVTKDTIKDIYKKSNVIKNSSKEIVEEIEEMDIEDLKIDIIKFSAFLIQNIEEMEKKIKSLEAELDKAYKELMIDSLTRAGNRKALERDLIEILEKGKNKDLDLCIAILDLEHFKEINDNYGHLVGDYVLIKIVQIIKSLIRKSDFVYRYGGDEFIIVFNHSNSLDAIKCINRILEKVEKTKFKYKDFIIKLTLSAGITCHKKGDDVESIIKRADEALYEAKTTRNMVKVK